MPSAAAEITEGLESSNAMRSAVAIFADWRACCHTSDQAISDGFPSYRELVFGHITPVLRCSCLFELQHEAEKAEPSHMPTKALPCLLSSLLTTNNICSSSMVVWRLANFLDTIYLLPEDSKRDKLLLVELQLNTSQSFSGMYT